MTSWADVSWMGTGPSSRMSSSSCCLDPVPRSVPPETQDQKPALCIGKPDEEIHEIPSDAC